MSHTVPIGERCPSSIGTAVDDLFDVEDSASGRIDFPKVTMVGGPLSSSSVTFRYANGSSQNIVMKLWKDNSTISSEVVFAPTGSWTTIGTVGISGIGFGGQYSLTTRDNIGPRFGSITFRWSIDCSGTQGCGWSTPTTGACPAEPLPGIPASDPVAPVARIITNPSTGRGEAPLTVTFDGSQSTDRNFDPLSYHWDFSDGSTASGQSVLDHVFETGIYYVTLEVSDPSGLSDRDVTQIIAQQTTPGNTQPQGVISGRTNLLLPHASVTLDASQSSDADDDPLDYVWYDSEQEYVQRSTTFDLTFTEPTASPYIVYLGVSDGRGGITNVTGQLTVQEPPEHECVLRYNESYPLFRTFVTLYNNTATPVQNWQAGFEFDAAVQINQTNGVLVSGSNPYTFQGSAGATDIPAYSWIVFWFDAESSTILQDIAITPLNGLNCLDNRPPRVNHAPIPALEITPQSGDNPLTVQFNAAGSTDPDGDPLSYRWHFGDGAEAVGETATHTYTSGGTFSGYLLVSDGTRSEDMKFNVTVTGDPGVSCHTVISNETGSNIRVFLMIQNKRDTVVNGLSGVLRLSAPISVTSTDDGLHIDPIENTYDVPFTVSQSIGPGELFSPQFYGTYTDADMYMTGCVVDSL